VPDHAVPDHPDHAVADRPPSTRPNLVLLGSGDPDYRGYALESLAATYPVLLVDRGPFDWQRSYVDQVLDCPPEDVNAVLTLLRGVEIGAVLTYDEFCVEAAADLAHRLGLRHNPPEVARRCRDKRLMRAAFARAGVPSPASIAVTDGDQAGEAATQIGYPVVLKPPALAGSIGVIRVDEPAELAERFALSNGARHARYGAGSGVTLVERYLPGDEVSVESLVVDGRPDPVAVTRKYLGPAPYFEERQHIVAPMEPLPDQDEIVRVVGSAHRALGVRWGTTHTELRLTPDGPAVVELAVRGAGDLIPLLVRLATGVDLMTSAAAGLLAGQPSAGGVVPPHAGRPLAPAAGVRFFYPSQDLEFHSAELRAGSWPWLVRFCCEATPGQPLRLPPGGYLDRIGYAVVTGATTAECERRLETVASALSVTSTPIGRPAGRRLAQLPNIR
jgi:hypothetical protein